MGHQDSEQGTGEKRETNSGMGLQPISKTGSNNYSKDAASVRERYQEYFVSEGVVEWQWELVSRTGNHHDAFLDRLM